MVCLFTQPCRGEDGGFRNTKWGMSGEAVTASEETMVPVEIGGDMIKYRSQLLGTNVELIYRFVQNKLIGASYQLIDNYLNSDHFLSSYKRFKEALTRKYGPPIDDRTKWLSTTFKNVSTKRGLALSLGHTEYSANWETPSTLIDLSLKEENSYVLCRLEYRSKEFAHLTDNINKEPALDPF